MRKLLAVALVLVLAAIVYGVTSIDRQRPDGNPVASPACAELSEKDCYYSATCTLVPVAETRDSGYFCRDSIPPCETDFRQAFDGDEDCTAKAGCVFHPEYCYCPPDLDCECAGGPPPLWSPGPLRGLGRSRANRHGQPPPHWGA